MAIQSERILDRGGKEHHIVCGDGDIGEYVLLPGDPFRTDKIAQLLDNPELIAHYREHKTWTGTLNGVKVTVTSTGMGLASSAIAVEELIHCGAKTLLRVGTCGPICPESQDPSLEGVIVTGAVRDEGTTIHYVPIEYPAMADRHVVDALARAAKKLEFKCVEGIVQSKDSLYCEYFPESSPNSGRLYPRWEAWEKSGVMASEMECAGQFIVAQIRGVRAGAIMSYREDTTRMMEVAIEAIRLMIEEEKQNA